jgi:hypothetical protein
MPKAYIIIPSPIPREEKQLAIVLKEEDIRRKMWDTTNSAAAATAAAAAATRGRMAELAKLVRELSNESEYFHSPNDSNVGRA